MGVPWALLFAVAIVAAVEAFLHTRPKMALIAYASDEGEYHAVRDTVEAQGPAEVALVGSSQMRECVVMSILNAEVDKRVGRHVWIANYSVRGARADAMNAEVRFLLRQPKPPTLTVVGISTRDMRAQSQDWPRLAIYWNLSDWWQAYRRNGSQVFGVLPQVIRNTVGPVLNTLRYREEIGLTLQRPFARFGVDAAEEGNPIVGEETKMHEGSRGQRSMVNNPVPLKKRLRLAQENYLFDKPAKPPAALKLAMQNLIRNFDGRPKAGLFVQMPVADDLWDVLIKNGQAKQFQTVVASEAKAVGVDFVPADAQTVHPTNDQYFDLQHLNRIGAEAYSVWLAGQIADRLKSR